jgi:L-ascorbate metabolism protein UlaG (beta-lactamase superfamily)
LSTQAELTWLGHSTVLVDLDGARVVTDPVLSRRVAHLWRKAPAPEIEPVDIVAVSHLHWDHFHRRSIAQLGRGGLLIVPADSEGRVAGVGAARVVGVRPGDVVEHDGLDIHVTQAEHSPGAVGFLLRGSRRVYFAGDTDVFEGMRELSDGLDVALLPIAGWGRTTPAGHLDTRGAVRALELLQPHFAVPIHWGTYAPFGVQRLSSRLDVAEEFTAEAAQRVPNVGIRVLPLGASFSF